MSQTDSGIKWFSYHCRISFPGVQKTTIKVAKLKRHYIVVYADLEQKFVKLGEVDIEMKIDEALKESKDR